MRIRQYARAVDDALRPLLHGDEKALILVAPQPVNSIFRQVCSAPTLSAHGVEADPDKWGVTEVAEAVRPVLAEHAAEADAALADLVNERRGQRRATNDVSDIARAASIGAVATLILDREYDERGSVRADGSLTLDPNGAVLAEDIGRLVVAHGGRVLALPADRLPGGERITAVLRYAQ